MTRFYFPSGPFTSGSSYQDESHDDHNEADRKDECTLNDRRTRTINSFILKTTGCNYGASYRLHSIQESRPKKMHASIVSTCICTATAWLSAGTASAKFFACRQACKVQRHDRFNCSLLPCSCTQRFRSLQPLALNCPCCAQRK